MKLRDGCLLEQLVNQQENTDFENYYSSEETDPFSNTVIAEPYKYIKISLRIKKRNGESQPFSIKGCHRSAEG